MCLKPLFILHWAFENGKIMGHKSIYRPTDWLEYHKKQLTLNSTFDKSEKTMEILELALAAYGVYNAVGTTTSIIGGIDVALKRFSTSTAEELFKKSFVNAVEQNAPNLADLTETSDPETVDVDSNLLDNVITSLKDNDIIYANIVRGKRKTHRNHQSLSQVYHSARPPINNYRICAENPTSYRKDHC